MNNIHRAIKLGKNGKAWGFRFNLKSRQQSRSSRDCAKSRKWEKRFINKLARKSGFGFEEE